MSWITRLAVGGELSAPGFGAARHSQIDWRDCVALSHESLGPFEYLVDERRIVTECRDLTVAQIREVFLS